MGSISPPAFPNIFFAVYAAFIRPIFFPCLPLDFQRGRGARGVSLGKENPMYSKVYSALLHGIESRLVSVEADVSEGLPVFEMVGFLASEVKEAKERVRTALRNNGYTLPVRRITVNVSPASIKKTGAGFDLPVAVSVLAAQGIVRVQGLSDLFLVGELGLNGDVLPVDGILPMVLAAREAGKRICVLPADNASEAKLVPDIEVVGVKSLKEVAVFLTEGKVSAHEELPFKEEEESRYDFSEVNGQKFLRRACEVAASGMHNLLMIGPPGSGKTMAAKCIPSILPPMSGEEQLELSKIYSVCGLFRNRRKLISKRPFRSPHHTVSVIGLTGGGSMPKPGEISLAHGGVLFLDELPEFQKQTIEILRQPLEEKKSALSARMGTVRFPRISCSAPL